MDYKIVLYHVREFFRRVNARAALILGWFTKLRNLAIVGLILLIGGFIHFAVQQLGGLPGDWESKLLRGTSVAYMYETYTPTPTATPTFTLTPSATPTATLQPPDGTPFPANTVGVVVADFSDDLEGLNNAAYSLALALKQREIPRVHVYQPIADETEARKKAMQFNAAVVVWGEKTQYSFHIFYVLAPKYDPFTDGMNDPVIPNNDQFSNFLIDNAIGIPYLVDFVQGLTKYFQHDYSGAVDSFSSAINKIPPELQGQINWTRAYFWRGNAYRYLQNFDAALDDLNHVLQLNPNDPMAYNALGVLYDDMRDYSAALDNYTHSISLYSQSAITYNNRGLAYYRLHQYDNALADYTQALELQPDYANVYNNRGNIYTNQHKYDLAISDFSNAIKYKPGYDNAYWGRGNAYYLSGDYAHALADYADYQRVTGKLQPMMQRQITIMEPALTATAAAQTATAAP